MGYSNPAEVFEGLFATLKNSINGWDYFVNWNKVMGQIRHSEIALNTLNYLVGKNDIREEAVSLLVQHPEVASVVPAFLAVRGEKIEILQDYTHGKFEYSVFDFSATLAGWSRSEAERIVEFWERSGFLSLLQDKRIKSLVDYLIGVEVGLDSNGRKNRGGVAMESIVGHFLHSACNRLGYSSPIQGATSDQVFRTFKKKFSQDKAGRKVDYVINLPDSERLVLVETNFYSGGGSKLKSTAGEYRELQSLWRKDGHLFIWITDGAGWRSAKAPLRDAFNDVDHIINLDMIEKGVLDALIS